MVTPWDSCTQCVYYEPASGHLSDENKHEYSICTKNTRRYYCSTERDSTSAISCGVSAKNFTRNKDLPFLKLGLSFYWEENSAGVVVKLHIKESVKYDPNYDPMSEVRAKYRIPEGVSLGQFLKRLDKQD